MKKALADPFVIACLGILVFLFYNLVESLYTEDPSPYLEQIQRDYQQAEQAKEQNLRKQKFTLALNSLLTLEDKYQPNMGDGKIYANIGTVFFQLQEIPMAILYYYKAKALRPRDTALENNLHLAQKKAGLKEDTAASPLQNLLFFHHYFSLPEKLQLFSLFTFLCMVLCSAYAWLKSNWLDKMALITALISLTFFLSASWSYYFAAAEGIVIHASKLYRGPGQQFAKAIDTPLLAGSKVQLLEASDKNFIKVLTKEGTIGFVLKKAVVGI